MTLEDLKELPVLQTKAVATAGEDPDTFKYIIACVRDMYAGNYGKVPQEDTDANNRELAAGYGRIVARYGQAEKLTEDIYIIASFDSEQPDTQEANYTMIMYCSEY